MSTGQHKVLQDTFVEETINAFTEEIGAARQRLGVIVADQHARRQAVEDTEAHRHLLQMQQTFQEKNAELSAFQDALEQINKQIQQERLHVGNLN